MRFIAGGNILTQQHVVEIPAGQYEELFLYIAGTNNAGQTLALTDMNNLRVNRNGFDFININIDLESALADLLAGMILSASAIGAAFTFGFHIPFYVGVKDQFPNVLTVLEEDNVRLHLDFGNLATPVAAGTFEVYGILKSGVENYVPVRVQDAIALAAAGALEKRKASINNIYSVYAFPSVAANFAKLTVERDDQTLFDSMYAPAAAYTNLVNRKEATAIAVAEARMAIGKRLDELLSQSIYVTPQSQTGAVTIEFVYAGAQFNEKTKLASVQVRDARISKNLEGQVLAGGSMQVGK